MLYVRTYVCMHVLLCRALLKSSIFFILKQSPFNKQKKALTKNLLQTVKDHHYA